MEELTREGLRDYILQRVREGFDDEDEIVILAGEYVTDEGREELLGDVPTLTAELFAEHRREQETWVGPTDCDRLDQAFENLNHAGVVARQNFTCCSTCGHYEIGDEIAEDDEDRPVIGYAFYHMQDTESAVEGGSVFLKYGAVDGDEQDARKVGELIFEAVSQAGLPVTWDGKSTTAVEVGPLDWRRRC